MKIEERKVCENGEIMNEIELLNRVDSVLEKLWKDQKNYEVLFLLSEELDELEMEQIISLLQN